MKATPLLIVLMLLFRFSFSTVCGNGICEPLGENAQDCSVDCCQDIYLIHYLQELGCIENNWTKVVVNVDNRPRNVMMKSPNFGGWENGALIMLHGGQGAHTSHCRVGSPEYQAGVDFTETAVEQGFGVFLLDSTYNQATDFAGRGVGKRWDCLDLDRAENATSSTNVDLPYIENVITELIPSLRPSGSSEAIFVAGLSTGGYMTAYVGIMMSHLIDAFAPVAGGDPFGVFFDMSEPADRDCCPGAVLDMETEKKISIHQACYSTDYQNERSWPESEPIPFRQFHHSHDCVSDVSCMWKLNELLLEHGFVEPEVPFTLDRESDPEWITTIDVYDITRGFTCHLEDHYWQSQYTQPILDFFKLYSSREDDDDSENDDSDLDNDSENDDSEIDNDDENVVGGIVGGILGGFAFVFVVIIFGVAVGIITIIICQKKKRKFEKMDETDVPLEKI